MTYCIDSCIFIDLNNLMPRDVWPSIWEAIEDLIASGQAFTCREVKTEIDKKDDELKAWLKAQPKGFVMHPSDQENQVVVDIVNRYPGWVQQQKNAADPWLVAHAHVHGRTLVTSERFKGPTPVEANMKIPQVANEYGVQWLSLNDLARQEGWKF